MQDLALARVGAPDTQIDKDLIPAPRQRITRRNLPVVEDQVGLCRLLRHATEYWKRAPIHLGQLAVKRREERLLIGPGRIAHASVSGSITPISASSVMKLSLLDTRGRKRMFMRAPFHSIQSASVMSVRRRMVTR